MAFGSKLHEVETPGEIDLQSFDAFKSDIEKIKKIVREVMVRQGNLRFKAGTKTGIGTSRWESIYELIADSDHRINFNDHSQDLSTSSISKLSLIFGDKDIVILFIVLIQSGILSISSSQVNKFPLELETKIFDIDPLQLRRRIVREGGAIRYQGLLIDNMFDRKNALLKKNGGRKLRTRTRKFVNGTSSQAVIPKRKLQESGQEFIKVLQMYIESLGIDMDFSHLTNEMKVVLEEEMTIHDRTALELILERGLELQLVRSKVKLRSSNILEGVKIEIEKYPGIKDGTGKHKWMPTFSEIEADNPDDLNDTRKRLKIDHLPTSTGGSTDVFDRFNAGDGYITFGKGAVADNSEFLRRDRLIDRGEQMMENGYFFNFE